MTATSKLALELLQNGAANQVLANTTFAQLNQLVQASVIDKDLSAPPGSPANEALYIVGAAPTGSWSGRAGQLAYWLTSTNAWQFVTPQAGFAVRVLDELDGLGLPKIYGYSGSAWIEQVSGGGGGGVSLPVVQELSSTRDLALSDINTFNVNSTVNNYTVTIPLQSSIAWTADAEIHFLKNSTGNVVITAAAGVLLNGVDGGSVTISLAKAGATIKRLASDSWWVGGLFGTVEAGAPYCTAGGTANAITLTPNNPAGIPSSYVAGATYRARIAATNTGATTVNVSGLGAKACVTVTGAALPAGYIRTGVDTEFTYDAVGDRFVVGRETEYGSNANGSFQRQANGVIDVWAKEAVSQTADGVTGNMFRAPADGVWTLPASVILSSDNSASASPANSVRWAGIQQTSDTAANIRSYQATSGATSIAVTARITGRWY